MLSESSVLKRLGVVEETVRMFDSFFDVHKTHSYILPFFDSVPRPDDGATADMRWSVAYVGASWAQIVAAVDIDYELDKGFRLYDESKGVAEPILQRLRSGEVHPTDELFAWHVLTRWLDGTAKLFYRSGDHTKARFQWEIALNILENAESELQLRISNELEFLYPDIKSSSIRNLGEEKRQTSQEKHVTSGAVEDEPSFQELVDATIGKFKEPELRGLLDDRNSINEKQSSKLNKLVLALSWRERERLRGLANLYQNGDRPEGVLRISTAMNDQLRRMQAFHNLAGNAVKAGALCLKNGDSKTAVTHYATAGTHWKKVRDSPFWIRGSFFARQRLAMLDARLLESMHPTSPEISLLAQTTCVRELFHLIDDIQEQEYQRSSKTNSRISDIDLHGWSVIFAFRHLQKCREAAAQLDIIEGTRLTEIEALENRMQEELEQMVQSHRSVVKIAFYKYAFAKYHSWAYYRILQHHLRRHRAKPDSNSVLGSCVRWSEEATSRELLDILAARKKRSNSLELSRTAKIHPFVVPDSLYGDYDESEICDATIARSTVRAEGAWNKQIESCVSSANEEFNELAMKQPLEAAKIPKEIYQKTLDFAEANNAVIIRFFQERENEYGVFVFFPSKECKTFRIENERLDSASVSLEKVLVVGNVEEVKASDFYEPLCQLGYELAGVFPQDMLEQVDLELIENLVIVPTGSFWRLPLHSALIDGKPLCCHTRVLYSGSLTALLEHGRFQSALVNIPHDKPVGVVTSLASSNPYSSIFGRRLASKLGDDTKVLGPASSDQKSTSVDPAILRDFIQANHFSAVYLGCHGCLSDLGDTNNVCLLFHNSEDDLGVVAPEQLSLFDTSEGIPLTILAACVSGLGTELSGGEISGFYRSIVAIGGGACMLSFWPVSSAAVDDFSFFMLKNAEKNSILNSYNEYCRNFEPISDSPKDVGREIMKRCCLALFV